MSLPTAPSGHNGEGTTLSQARDSVQEGSLEEDQVICRQRSLSCHSFYGRIVFLSDPPWAQLPVCLLSMEAVQQWQVTSSKPDLKEV